MNTVRFRSLFAVAIVVIGTFTWRLSAQQLPHDTASGDSRPGILTPTANANGTYGDVILDGDGASSLGGILLKPHSDRPWTEAVSGSSGGGFVVFNTARNRQLFTVRDAGTVEILGGTTPLVVYGSQTTSPFTIYDSASQGMAPGGVVVSIGGAGSVLNAGGLQMGYGNSPIINAAGGPALILNPWFDKDVWVGDATYAPHSGLRVLGAGSTSTFAGKVGIGTTAPLSSLHVVQTDGGTWPRGIILDHITPDGTAAFFMGRHARGTPTAPTVVGNGDNILAIVPGAFDGAAYLSPTRVLFTIDGPPSQGNTPVAVRFTSGGTAEIERMRITSAGNVLIGSTTPDPNNSLLYVNGNANFTGTVTGGNIRAKFQDMAEWVPAAEDLAPGTVVILDPGKKNTVARSTRAYDTTVAGVVSFQPGILLGVEDAAKEAIATTGRVRVKVDASSHAIAIGDLLVTSDKPGVAMRSKPIDVGGVAIHRPGTIIGKALEELDGGEGEILVLLSLQ